MPWLPERFKTNFSFLIYSSQGLYQYYIKIEDSKTLNIFFQTIFYEETGILGDCFLPKMMTDTDDDSLPTATDSENSSCYQYLQESMTNFL